MANDNKRDILFGLSYRFQGQWDNILQAIKEHDKSFLGQLPEYYHELKSGFITLVEPEYPDGLKQGYKPPFLLYYYGNISLLKSQYRLTCVGSRKPTLYQMNRTTALIEQTEKEFHSQLVIVSGMAYGIDQVSMKAAMDSAAPVIAVIGSGIDNPYPKNNQGIYEYCKEGKGLVLSEYPGTMEAKPENFLFRNRMLACLSEVIYIGAGKSHSGTHATVKYALDAGKEIVCLPCDSTGDDLTNTLIKNGADSILDSTDLVYSLHSIYD